MNLKLNNKASLIHTIFKYLGTVVFSVLFTLLLGGFVVSADNSNVLKSFELGGSEPYYRVELSYLKLSGSYTDIRFAVWSKDKGQDDLVWYSGRPGPGVYYVEIPLVNHNSNGIFYVHAYARMSNGQMQFLNATSFTYQSTAASITANDSTGNQTSFQITASNPKVVGGVSRIQAAVWSKDAGQDDLVWYNASANGSVYRVNVPVSNHRSAGKYYVHIYAINRKGSMIFLGDTSFTVSPAAGASVRVSMADRQHGTFRVTVSNVSAPSGVQEVQVPVWCSENQSDILWYTAVRQSDGTYVFDVNTSLHRGHTGKYKIHVYVTMGNGIRNLDCYTTYNYTPQASDRYVAAGTLGSMRCTPVQNKSGYYHIDYDASASDMSMQGIDFAVWSNAGGTDDMLWFPAVKQSDGSYGADIPISSFKDLGLYNAEAYALFADGSRAKLQSDTFTVAAPSASDFRITDVNLSAGTFRVQYSGIQHPESVRKLQLEIHTTAASDHHYLFDIKYGNGQYTYDVSVADLNYTFGTYVVSLLLTDITGKTKTVSTASCDMKPVYSDISLVDYYNNETVQGVFLQDLVVPGGTTQVQFAVWSTAGGQDDLIWYSTQKTGTSYYHYIQIKDHHTPGEYKVHIYATKKNGERELIATKTFRIDGKPTAKIKYEPVDPAAGRYRVVAYDIKALSGISKVEIPVWCHGNQNDIKWYAAVRQSDGTYAADVFVGNHKYHTGTYTAHVYITMGNGICCCVGGTSFAVSASSSHQFEAYAYAEQRLNQIGWNLLSAFQWAASLPYYNNGNSNGGIPAGYRFDEYEAIYGFTNLKGDCEVMAAVFYYMAKQLGYDAHMVRGSVPLRSGGMGPHAWVEINMAGTVYVFDPDFTHESGRNGFQITYGSSGTWRYSNYARIN